jgi:hypothetical protein
MSVKQKEQFLTALTENNNSQSAIFSKAEAIAIADAAGLKSPMWFFKDKISAACRRNVTVTCADCTNRCRANSTS